MKPALNPLIAMLIAALLLGACSPGEDNSQLILPERQEPSSAPDSESLASENPSRSEQPTSPTLTPVPAPDADVLFVRASYLDGSWTFSVTVSHPDTGWEDYTNGWDVVTPSGMAIKANPDDLFTRELAHPHVNEQPFTRSQTGIIIPTGISQVTVRAHDLVHGFGGQEIEVDLDQSSGPGYEVIR